MKKHFSVFALFVRSTFWPVLAVCTGVSCVQALLFYRAFLAAAAAPEQEAGFEALLQTGRTAAVAGVGLVLLALILCRCGWASASRVDYTLQRLRISERAVLGWQALHNVLWLVLYWALQLLTVAALGAYYRMQCFPGPAGSQLLMLAAWRSPYLHSLLPLADASRWACLLAMVAGVGVEFAVYSHRRRHGRRGVSTLLLAALLLATFCRAPGEAGGDVALVLTALTAVALSLYFLPTAELEEDTAHETA